MQGAGSRARDPSLSHWAGQLALAHLESRPIEAASFRMLSQSSGIFQAVSDQRHFEEVEALSVRSGSLPFSVFAFHSPLR